MTEDVLWATSWAEPFAYMGPCHLPSWSLRRYCCSLSQIRTLSLREAEPLAQVT